MDEDVCVTADGGGEVSVEGDGQPIVQVLGVVELAC